LGAFSSRQWAKVVVVGHNPVVGVVVSAALVAAAVVVALLAS
jgi:phosphohistidine phosphatase SixA